MLLVKVKKNAERTVNFSSSPDCSGIPRRSASAVRGYSGKRVEIFGRCETLLLLKNVIFQLKNL
ncbi:hypothetical protein EGI11_06945 [Chryseobacterium sp. H3056]|uniref:Uncharacterized protein n=1 Tax=Kaistella daneshvariae TaxID=2487074 RepID=A0A3N0WVP0_9FLAO|nr:hypothetical protein EGI11_06945 [Kaistella daneshvariae]